MPLQYSKPTQPIVIIHPAPICRPERHSRVEHLGYRVVFQPFQQKNSAWVSALLFTSRRERNLRVAKGILNQLTEGTSYYGLKASIRVSGLLLRPIPSLPTYMSSSGVRNLARAVFKATEALPDDRLDRS